MPEYFTLFFASFAISTILLLIIHYSLKKKSNPIQNKIVVEIPLVKIEEEISEEEYTTTNTNMASCEKITEEEFDH